jgi:hypothetical protein
VIPGVDDEGVIKGYRAQAWIFHRCDGILSLITIPVF